MNFFTHLATSAANFVLLIGRRFAAEFFVLICDARETDGNRINVVALAFDFQDEHPTNWKGRSGVIGARRASISRVI